MQAVFKVQNVKCGGCAQAIQSGLGELGGVSDVQVDVASGTVEVDGENLSRTQLADKLKALGYPERETA